MNIYSLTYQMSGADGDGGTIIGDLTLPNGQGGTIASESISIGAGGGNTIGAQVSKPLNGITLACVQGTMNIIMAV